MYYELRMLRYRCAAGLAVLGVLVAGCGGGGESPQPAPSAAPSAAATGPGEADPMQWADAYCSGVTAARDAAVAELSTVQPEPAAQQDALLRYLEAAIAAYQQSLDRLQQVGAPAVASGQEYQRTALDLYGRSLEAARSQRQEVTALDPAAPDFMQRFTGIVQSGFDRVALQERTDAVSRDAELAPVLERTPACQQGRPGGGG